jgi:hypothetical protein
MENTNWKNREARAAKALTRAAWHGMIPLRAVAILARCLRADDCETEVQELEKIWCEK